MQLYKLIHNKTLIKGSSAVESHSTCSSFVRIFRYITAVLLCWTIAQGIAGAISLAAESENFQVIEVGDTPGAEYADQTSDNFQVTGGISWVQDSGLVSESFQIVSNAPSSASSSGQSSSSSSETSAGSSGSQNGSTSGGGTRGDTTHEAATEEKEVVAPPQKTDSVPVAPGKSIEEPAKKTQNRDTPKELDVERARSFFDKRDGATNGLGTTKAIVTPDFDKQDAAQTKAEKTEEILTETVSLASLTVAEAGILARLGQISRFEQFFSAIPAYQAPTSLVRSIALGVRPGAVSIQFLLFPLSLYRWLRRKFAL